MYIPIVSRSKGDDVVVLQDVHQMVDNWTHFGYLLATSPPLPLASLTPCYRIQQSRPCTTRPPCPPRPPRPRKPITRLGQRAAGVISKEHGAEFVEIGAVKDYFFLFWYILEQFETMNLMKSRYICKVWYKRLMLAYLGTQIAPWQTKLHVGNRHFPIRKPI